MLWVSRAQSLERGSDPRPMDSFENSLGRHSRMCNPGFVTGFNIGWLLHTKKDGPSAGAIGADSGEVMKGNERL